jgi:protein-tyrosine phosphatase
MLADRHHSGVRFSALFVCTGNICRSPTAEGVFRKLADNAGLGARILADSAGTHAYHLGEAPDARAQTAAARRGYDLSGLRARRVEPADFRDFDLIVAMDREHQSILARMAPLDGIGKLRLMMSYARRPGGRDVPDPYYGAAQDFERVLDMIEDAAQGLLDTLVKNCGFDSG